MKMSKKRPQNLPKQIQNKFEMKTKKLKGFLNSKNMAFEKSLENFIEHKL